MPVADVMSPRVVSVQPDELVRVAIARMLEAGIGAVAVCEGVRLVGIFTERDVLRLAGASEGADFGGLRLGDVMTRAPLTIAPDDEIFDAAHLMSERQIRHLPVVQGENLLGVLGIRDVMAALVERLWRVHDENARKTVRALLRRPPAVKSSPRPRA